MIDEPQELVVHIESQFIGRVVGRYLTPAKDGLGKPGDVVVQVWDEFVKEYRWRTEEWVAGSFRNATDEEIRLCQ